MAKQESKIRLRDVLGYLTLLNAEKFLGPRGKELIREGGRWFDIDITEQVIMDSRRFRVFFPEAVVTLTLSRKHRGRLRFECTKCHDACIHVGATFAFILDEKLALGLAKPPEEKVPIESLTEEELVVQALKERAERAVTEDMVVKSADRKELWTDYTVLSKASGKTYRVALRGWEAGDSFCTCPDYRVNTLGTCKHVMRVADWAKKRFSAKVKNAPYEHRDVRVALGYLGGIQLRLLMPPALPPDQEAILGPFRDCEIEDVGGFVVALRHAMEIGCDVLVYPDAEEYIQQRLHQARVSNRMAEIRRDPAGHPLRLELLRAELLPYQLDGVAFVVGAGRAVLADDMGLGKTIQGIGAAELLARERGIKRVLVVCPVSLKSQWREEVHRFTDRDVQLVMGNAEERSAQYTGDTFYTICNYEQVLRDILHIEVVPWDFIILDEGQRIKNWEAKTTRVVKGLASPFALVLSGTPLENRLAELFSVVEFIDSCHLGPAFRFFNRHRVVNDRGRVLGYKNLDDLRERLKVILLRRTRAGVMRQLPERTTEYVRIRPTDEQAALHYTNYLVVNAIVRKPYLTEMDLLRLQKALLLCRMAANGTFQVTKEEPNYSSKLEELDGMLATLAAEEDRKVIVFTEWTTMLDLIEPLLEKHSLDYVRLDGSVPQKKRPQLVNRFNTDKDCRFFLATNAGATGLNLQAANTVINVDLPWNPAVLEQRISRAHRMGQKRPVQVFVLITEETIEERLLYTLAAKQELADASLMADSEVSEVSLSTGIDELKKRLEVVLGTKPDAPVDVSVKVQREAEAVALAERKARVAEAGGQLLSAAFSFFGELLPEQEETTRSAELAKQVRERLGECMTTDENGKLQLTVTLPDGAALDGLASAVARLIGTA